MIKGVRIGGMGKALSYLDKLTVPIIENTPHEEDLKDSMALVRTIIVPSPSNPNR
jgi:methylthioribulose-1-phosphate dehydratase